MTRLSTILFALLLLAVPAMADWIEFTSPSTNFTLSYCTNLNAPNWTPWLWGNKSILVSSDTIDALNPRQTTYLCPSWSTLFTWGAVSNASIYRLRWGTSPGVYTSFTDTASNSCAVPGLVGRTTYYFVVSAGTNGPLSSETVFTPPYYLSFPTVAVFFQAGTNQLTINKAKG